MRQRTDHDRRSVGPWSARPELEVASLVELPDEIDRARPQEGNDDLQRFLEPADPPFEGVPEHLVFGLIVACPETEYQPAPTDLVDRICHLGE